MGRMGVTKIVGLESDDQELDFKHYRIQAIRAAEDFHYGKDIIHMLEQAETDTEIAIIMANARRRKFR